MIVRTAFVLGFFAAASALSAQQTFVVDALGSGTHKTIQAAVDVAKDQDRIVIMSGTYEENVRVTGKSLWILGAGTTPTMRSLKMFAHPSSRTTRLTNLRISPSSTVKLVPCEFRGSGQLVMERVQIWTTGTLIDLGQASRIVLQDSRFGSNVFVLTLSTSSLNHGLQVNSAGLLLMNGCSVSGAPGRYFFVFNTAAGVGLILNGGIAEIAASSINGGDGASYLCGMDITCGKPGAHGLIANGATVRLRGSPTDIVAGGTGGWTKSFTQNYQARGGDAIRVSNGGRLDYSGIKIRLASARGKGVVVIGGSASLVTPADPLLILTRGFRFGTSATFYLRAKPSSAAVVLLCLGTAPLSTPFGPLYADLGTLITTFATTINAGGAGSLSIPTGNNLGILGLPLYLQAVEIDAQLQLRLTGMVGSVPSLW